MHKNFKLQTMMFLIGRYFITIHAIQHNMNITIFKIVNTNITKPKKGTSEIFFLNPILKEKSKKKKNRRGSCGIQFKLNQSSQNTAYLWTNMNYFKKYIRVFKFLCQKLSLKLAVQCIPVIAHVCDHKVHNSSTDVNASSDSRGKLT